MAYFDNGESTPKFRDAAAEFREAIRLKPDFVAAYCNLGASLIPNDLETHYQLGLAYLDSGNESGAVNECNILKRLIRGKESASGEPVLAAGRLDEFLRRYIEDQRANQNPK